MSNRRKLLPYGQRAREALPGYVTPTAPCDVPTCSRKVGGSRTITLVAEDGTYASILIRLCHEHTDAPYGELLKLLPALAEVDAAAGPLAYMREDTP